MRIAVIGSGIAGHGAALALSQPDLHHEVVVYERDVRSGGHARTVEVDLDGTRTAADIGFIVYNERNYPELSAMFDWLGVATQASDMSFSVSVDGGRFEWCGRDGRSAFNGLFAQRRNLVSPSYLRLLKEILRFQAQASSDVRDRKVGPDTIDDYLRRHRFSQRLRDDYLVPMSAAIWSMPPARILEFPAESLLAFFDNHHLLQWNRPRWRTVVGGSRHYVEAIAAHLGKRLKLGSAVAEVRAVAGGLEVIDVNRHAAMFDQVVVATPAPDACAMVSDLTDAERAILGACTTSPNDAYLHRDARLMPRRRAAWASWNFLRAGRDQAGAVSVTYWLNPLQSLPYDKPLFLTLNPSTPPDPSLTLLRTTFAHPQFDRAALQAQKALPTIQGQRGLWFCGAWTGYGFHEDGLRSGLAVAQALGAAAPWHQTERLRSAA